MDGIEHLLEETQIEAVRLQQEQEDPHEEDRAQTASQSRGQRGATVQRSAVDTSGRA